MDQRSSLEGACIVGLCIAVWIVPNFTACSSSAGNQVLADVAEVVLSTAAKAATEPSKVTPVKPASWEMERTPRESHIALENAKRAMTEGEFDVQRGLSFLSAFRTFTDQYQEAQQWIVTHEAACTAKRCAVAFLVDLDAPRPNVEAFVSFGRDRELWDWGEVIPEYTTQPGVGVTEGSHIVAVWVFVYTQPFEDMGGG